MDDSSVRREACRPRRVSVAAELGANVSLRDDNVAMVTPVGKYQPVAGRLSSAAGRMERRHSTPQVVHQRHMPMEPNKFHIPRKTKEKKALFQFVSTESREYEDMKNVLTSSYIDSNSGSCFTYSNPRLVHSELLEKEFVEKRKEMKADGRTDKEMEESYCFLITTSAQLPLLCEKGLTVGQSRITMLGDPKKGVYLSKYSDLLRTNPFTPGATGEIIIFKVMKGKVKSVYENMKTLQDPTPRFDSHVAKNASKVTSLTCHCAFEYTQQYFYEYLFAEPQQRPRQVCPYAVVSFYFKGKDAPPPSKPAAAIRLNSQPSERSNERAQFPVWSGDVVKKHRVLFHVSLMSNSVRFLPHKLPEKLDVGFLMRLDHVTRLIPSNLLSSHLYSSSREVVADGHHCSLLEVVDRSQSTVNMKRLLQELETKRVVLVSLLTDRGFLFLLSSAQMSAPSERGETWKRCLQALFVFPETRDVSKFRSSRSFSPSKSLKSEARVMHRLKEFIPALHQALMRVRVKPPSVLSAGVEHQTREYLSGLKDGSVPMHNMAEYDPILDQEGKLSLPKHHRVSNDSYLQSYLTNPSPYLLSVSQAEQVVLAHYGPERPQGTRNGSRGQVETGDGQNSRQKMQQLLDLILTSKRNAEIEVRREEGEGSKAPERKRKLEQETAKRALKYFKASQETGRSDRVPVGGNKVPSPPFSFTSVIGSLGLKDMDLREDASEITNKFIVQLKGLIQTANQSEAQDEGQKDFSPFGHLATKLGLPTNRDVDLRQQEELEEHTAGSVCSGSEGFSPSSHSGETNHHFAPSRERKPGRKRAANEVEEEEEEEEEEEWKIPWVLIPITGLNSGRYSQRDGNIPEDPRCQHLTTATSITTATKPPRKSPTLFPECSPSPPTAQQPSPDPSPPPSPSQCPSPDPSPPASPSQCPSPDPSPPASPSQCPSPDPSSPAESPSPGTVAPPAPAQRRSPESTEPNSLNKKQSGANMLQLAPAVLKEFQGVFDTKPQWIKMKREEPSDAPAPELRSAPPLPPSAQVMESEGAAGPVKPKIEPDLCLQPKVEQEEEEMRIDFVNEQKKGEVSSTSAAPLRDIDRIVDKHLGDFTSDVQLLLQERGSRSVPQFPRSSSNADHATRPYTSLSPFSHFVSFYNPCPPVQDYVESLRDSMKCMLGELNVSSPQQQASSSREDIDETLAQRINDFVASYRGGGSQTRRSQEAFQQAAGVESPATQASVFSRVGEVWQPEEPTWTPQSPQMSTSDPNSVFVPYKPEDSLEICRTITQNVTEDDAVTRTVVCTAAEEAQGSLLGSDCIVTVPGYSTASNGHTEPSLSYEPASSPSSAPVQDAGSEAVPSTKHLSSVINQLNPDVLNNLVEIAKDIKRKSPQFYVHCTELGDAVYEEVKEHLLKLGNVQQSPVDFLHNENSENGLLVIIKNKDTAGNIHKIPGLMSLKRHASVVFVGIDSLDDIKNNSCIELFVSGGCIVSDELVLSPDVITHDRLLALLTLLEQHSSPESVWRWKVHCKTQKKLKEQARFRKDAAILLEILSTYQKRQIVEFLPYHHCDMTNQQSPDLDCLLELQARYTQFRHTIYLTEHHFEKFPSFSNGGIIVASVEEVLQNFSRLVGCHDIRDKQLLVEDLLAPKGLSGQLNHQDSGFDLFPETVPSSNQPLEGLPQPPSTPPSVPHVSDQIVPEAFGKDWLSPSTSRDMVYLQQALQQLRAERLEQLQQLKQQQQILEVQLESSVSSVPPPAAADTPPPLHEGPTEHVQLSAALESIHSALQPALWQESREDRPPSPTEGGDPCPQVGSQMGNWTSSNTESSLLSSNHTAAAEPDRDGTEGEPNQQEPVSLTAAEQDVSTAEDGSRDQQSNQEQPGILQISSTTAVAKATRIPVLMDRNCDSNPAPNLHHAQQPGPFQPVNQPHQRGVGLQHNPFVAPLHNQRFHPGHLLRPLGPLRGIRNIMGPAHLWPGGIPPVGAPLIWGYQQTGVDFLRGFYGPAGPGGHAYRGARPGGGFNGM